MTNQPQPDHSKGHNNLGAPSRFVLAAGIMIGLTLLLILGICGPRLLRLRKDLNNHPPAAVQALRNINSAQAVYESGIGNGNYTSNLAVLGGGTASTEVGLLDSTVVNAQTTPKSGYLLGPIVTVAKTPKSPARYSMTAFPASAKGISRTGYDCYFIDETGIIRHSGRPDVPATATSEPIKE
jgi:type IV pilus assembly protein PilA